MDRWQEFEAGGITFRLKPLLVRDAEELAQPLIELITPVAAALVSEGKSFREVSEAMFGLGRAVKQERTFREKFVKVCQYRRTELEGSPFVDLEPFFNDVFERKHLARYAWLRECIELEFGDFLGAIGQGAMAKLVAKLSGFLSGFDGAFGESQPTQESKTATSTSETAGPSLSSAKQT